MPPVVEFQTQIKAPAEKVFAYIANLEKHPEWTHCSEITKTSDGPVGVGTWYNSVGKNLGMTTREKVEITECQPNQRFAWRAHGAMGMDFDWSFEVKPQDGGTLLIERLQPPAGPLANILWMLFAQRETRKGVPEGLAKIKQKLESS